MESYIYYIADPRLPEKTNIVYVGNADQPWLAVERHLRKSSNPQLEKWAQSIRKDYPEGVQILQEIVCQKFHGHPVTYPAKQQGITRIEWGILAYEGDIPFVDSAARIVKPAVKSYWIHRLRSEGHPLLNGVVGRPLKLD